jgi:ubiquinone/menaquinone biosynthesis C-methylase UbiE
MSKQSKRKKNSCNNKHEDSKEIILPRVFLKKMGITPYTDGEHDSHMQDIANEIGKRFGNTEYQNLFKMSENGNTVFNYLNSKLELTKLLHRSDYHRFCRIANALRDIPMAPDLKILDVGGSTGLMAFYMAQIWKNSEITVADKYSNVGSQWAKEIGVNRVSFIDSILPDLPNIPDQHYDVVVLSRVLNILDELNLPSFISTSWDNYSKSKEGIHRNEELKKIAASLKRVMKQDGSLIVVESWSGDRVLIVGKAFEQIGLFIDLDRFSLGHVSKEYSIITFSNAVNTKLLRDIPLALSTKVDEKYNDITVHQMAAESLRNFFESEPPVMEFEFIEDDKVMKYELFEKNGMALFSVRTSEGQKMATLSSAVDIPKIIEMYKKGESEIASDCKYKITQSVTVR